MGAPSESDFPQIQQMPPQRVIIPQPDDVPVAAHEIEPGFWTIMDNLMTAIIASVPGWALFIGVLAAVLPIAWRFRPKRH